MYRKQVSSLAIVLLLVSSAAAKPDKLDQYIRAEMEKQHIPGLSLAVVRNGKLAQAKGYGLANVELNVPATPQTVYRIGSVSKQFIAAEIMMLVEEGKLNLDDKISKYLTEAPDAWKDITIRHLLAHTSGLVRDAPGFNPLKLQADIDVIKSAYTLPLQFRPGDKWEYSNTGYFTLAEIVIKASGKPWSEYIAERVFKPLGMSATRTTTFTDIVPNRASGYIWRDGKLENADVLLALRPSGAFLSTVLDMARWDTALYTERILKQSSLEQMWKPVVETSRKSNGVGNLSYGLGWFLDRVNGQRIVSHPGSLRGFRAAFVRYVDARLTVIILTNSNDADADAIARGVAAIYTPGLPTTPAK